MARLFAWGVAAAMALAALIGTPAIAQTNLVTNGGFETAGGATGVANCSCTGSFAGWTFVTAPGASTSPARIVAPGREAVAGTNRALLNSFNGRQGISQNVNLSAGRYTFSFYYRGNGDGVDNEFQAFFGTEAVINSPTTPALTGNTYTFATFTRTVTGPTTIRFLANNDGGGISLDDVSIVAAPAVPEPGAWALMIFGFGLTGAALRRRQNVRRAAPLTA